MRIPRSAILLSILTALACNESLGPGSGTVRITLAVIGLDLDPDGYVATADGGESATIPGPGSVTLDLDSGDHTIVLGGLAPNCASTGPAAQSVTVRPSETTEISFAVRCTAVSGMIEVRVFTTGPDPDVDGYELDLDGGPVQAILPTSQIWFAGVPGGSHSLGLTGSAPNCSTVGPNPLEVSVEIGGIVRDVAHVTIYVSCTAQTGVVGHRRDTGSAPLALVGGERRTIGVPVDPHDGRAGCGDADPQPRQHLADRVVPVGGEQQPFRGEGDRLEHGIAAQRRRTRGSRCFSHAIGSRGSCP